MKLYRYELGSDDGDEEVLAGKKLVDDFTDPHFIFRYIRDYYAPLAIHIEEDESISQYKVLVAVPKHATDELPDESLWLLE